MVMILAWLSAQGRINPDHPPADADQAFRRIRTISILGQFTGRGTTA
jgi:hypothetical protein